MFNGYTESISAGQTIKKKMKAHCFPPPLSPPHHGHTDEEETSPKILLRGKKNNFTVNEFFRTCSISACLHKHSQWIVMEFFNAFS